MKKDTARKPRTTAEPIITVSTVFAGKQTDREAFIDLIAKKSAQKKPQKNQKTLDNTQNIMYNVSNSETQNARKRSIK